MKKKEKTEQEKKDDEIVDLILKSGNIGSGKDISEMFNAMYGKIIQRLLDTELEIHLEEEKKADKTSKNRKNGVTSQNKKLKSPGGEIKVKPPRDRNGTFEPQIVKKRQKTIEGFEEKVIAMYAKGMSLSDIREMIKEIYKVELSNDKISRLTQSVSEEVKEWKKRALNKCYPFVYVDCLYCHVKENLKSEKKAVYVVLGVDTLGKKEVLSIHIEKTESASTWTSILEDIKERGVEDIFFLSMDGLAGLPEAVEGIFPRTIVQRCIVHIVRNLYSVVTKKESKEVISDFKKIYTASNLESAKMEYKDFVNKYKEKKNIIKKVENIIEWIYQLYEYPEAIRKVIYTTNAIESLNAALRKVTKGKGSFINQNALEKVLYLRIKDLETKWSKGVKNWKNIQHELIEIFEERYTKYGIKKECEI